MEIASCLKGQEATVALDDGRIAISNIDARQLWELPYKLHTVRDLYWQIAAGRCGHISELHNLLAKVQWAYYLQPGGSVSVKAKSFRSRLYHESMLVEQCEKHLVKLGYQVATQSSQSISIELRENSASICLVLGGQPLYQRNYRSACTLAAPLPEHIAAASLHWLLPWLQSEGAHAEINDVLVPFAGSGTYGFEAAIHLLNLPNWLWERSYAMERLPCFAKESAAFGRRQQIAALKELGSVRLQFCEKDASLAAKIAEHRARFCKPLPAAMAMLEESQIYTGDALSWQPELQPQGTTLVLMNPPYGHRLSGGGWGGVKPWVELGQWLNQQAQRTPALGGLVLIPHEAAWRALLSTLQPQLKAHATRHMMHGGLDLRVLAFLFARPDRMA